VKSGLEIGFLLDRLWHRIRGEMEQSKQPALLAVARILADASVPYALIGGVALQVHQEEPRTTLDIDIAVAERSRIPRAELEAAGFRETGVFAHSVNWVSGDGTPLQFTDDPALAGAIERAQTIMLERTALRVIRRQDLLREKLRAGADPARRRSKRLQDLADAQSLLEQDPGLAADLTSAERAQLERLPP
jgi:hypothetical protein